MLPVPTFVRTKRNPQTFENAKNIFCVQISCLEAEEDLIRMKTR